MSDERAAAWQAAYDAGMTTAQIAAGAGVHRTTVAAAIRTTGRTGRRPTVTPDMAIAAMRAGGTIDAAAARLGVTRGGIRHALWRAGIVNFPGTAKRDSPDLGWETVNPGGVLDIEDRIIERGVRLRGLAGEGLDAGEISARTGVDVELVARVLRDKRRLRKA